jgi:hypothetical protein
VDLMASDSSGMIPGQGKVLELVVFDLREAVTREQFLATDPAMSAWIQTQPGYVAHEMLYSAERGMWVFIGWWRTLKDAQDADVAARASEECAPMLSLIDMDNVLFLHGEPAAATVTA